MPYDGCQGEQTSVDIYFLSRKRCEAAPDI